jgi:hypothetical protein
VVAAGEQHDRMSPADVAGGTAAGRRLTEQARSRIREAARQWEEKSSAAFDRHARDESVVASLTRAEAMADPYRVMASLVDMPSVTAEVMPALIAAAPVTSIDEASYYGSYLRAVLRSRRTRCCCAPCSWSQAFPSTHPTTLEARRGPERPSFRAALAPGQHRAVGPLRGRPTGPQLPLGQEAIVRRSRGDRPCAISARPSRPRSPPAGTQSRQTIRSKPASPAQLTDTEGRGRSRRVPGSCWHDRHLMPPRSGTGSARHGTLAQPRLWHRLGSPLALSGSLAREAGTTPRATTGLAQRCAGGLVQAPRAQRWHKLALPCTRVEQLRLDAVEFDGLAQEAVAQPRARASCDLARRHDVGTATGPGVGTAVLAQQAAVRAIAAPPLMGPGVGRPRLPIDVRECAGRSRAADGAVVLVGPMSVVIPGAMTGFGAPRAVGRALMVGTEGEDEGAWDARRAAMTAPSRRGPHASDVIGWFRPVWSVDDPYRRGVVLLGPCRSLLHSNGSTS